MGWAGKQAAAGVLAPPDSWTALTARLGDHADICRQEHMEQHHSGGALSR